MREPSPYRSEESKSTFAVPLWLWRLRMQFTRQIILQSLKVTNLGDSVIVVVAKETTTATLNEYIIAITVSGAHPTTQTADSAPSVANPSGQAQKTPTRAENKTVSCPTAHIMWMTQMAFTVLAADSTCLVCHRMDATNIRKDAEALVRCLVDFVSIVAKNLEIPRLRWIGIGTRLT
jgi:hypothetical protein